MSSLVIEGGRRLAGRVAVEGNKNAALPLLAACLLTDEACVLTNVPRIGDVEVMARLLENVGAEVQGLGTTTLRVRCRDVRTDTPDAALVGRLRGSVLLLGPLLARCGSARLAPPGGDFPTRRTIATHLDALRAMGAVELPGAGHVLEAPDGLRGASRVPRRGVGDRHRDRGPRGGGRRGARRRSGTPRASRTSSSSASSCAAWVWTSRARGPRRFESRGSRAAAARSTGSSGDYIEAGSWAVVGGGDARRGRDCGRPRCGHGGDRVGPVPRCASTARSRRTASSSSRRLRPPSGGSRPGSGRAFPATWSA